MNKIVRLTVPTGINLKLREISFPSEKPVIEISSDWDDMGDESYPTLRDIAIIMYHMVGNGATKQLANELSKRLGFDKDHLHVILKNIIKEYSYMSEHEAEKRWDTLNE